MIASSPALLAEATAALPALREQATSRCGEAVVREVIGRRFALFPQPQRSDGEWAMWWADYYEALSDLPRAALEAAMAAYVKLPDSEFMAKPGKLLELAKVTPNRGAQAYARALRATTETPERTPVPPEESAKVREMLGEYLAKISTRRAEEPRPLPDSFWHVDDAGLTPEMRRLTQRREAEAEERAALPTLDETRAAQRAMRDERNAYRGGEARERRRQ